MSIKIERPDVEVDMRVEDPGDEYPVVETNLAAYIQRCWGSAKTAKQDVLERIIRCERQRRGVYDPDRASEIAQTGGSDIYMMLTDVKCRAAESWIRDVLYGTKEKVFELTPSNEPVLPGELSAGIVDQVRFEAAEVMGSGEDVLPETVRARMEEVHEATLNRFRKEALDAARRMEDKIDDQLTEGKFYDAMRDFVNDFVTFPAAIMKGPTVRRQKGITWGEEMQPIVTTEFVRTFERVSPYDIFPSPTSSGVNDGYIFQRHHLTRGALLEMLGTPGYNSDAIRTIIDRYGTDGYRNYLPGDSENRLLSGKPQSQYVNDDTIEVLEFWGSVNGTWLLEWGMEEPDVMGDREYEVNAWVVGDIVFRCVINPDPLGRRPYETAAFEEVPNSFWGIALPEIMRDTQIMCNAAARALANNMGVASGPQVEVAIDRLPDGEQITDIYPWKIWQTTSDRTGGGQPAVKFYQPNMNADVLLGVYQQFARQADEVTGIPNYVYGSSNVAGAGRTASGLSMLMDNASKGIKQAVANIDKIVSGIVDRLYLHNMMYGDDQFIKGDFKIQAKGAIGLLHKEQQMMRRNEFLIATANPIDSQIVGPEGRAYLLREMARGLGMDTDKIVPDSNHFEQQRIQMLAQQMAAQMLQQLAAQQQMMAQQQMPQAAQEAGPDGAPMGGVGSNLMQ